VLTAGSLTSQLQWDEGFTAKDAVLLRANVRAALSQQQHECLLHPLGFYFIRLAQYGALSFRLHYYKKFDRGNGTALTPYHDHVWRLHSCILSGHIENVIVDTPKDCRGQYWKAAISQIGGVDEVLPIKNQVAVVVRTRDKFSAGEFYQMEPRTFHYTDVPPEQSAITLVRSEILVQGGPLTLVPVGFEGRHAPARDPLYNSESVIGEILSLLS
jgi:hypothetical protein